MSGLELVLVAAAVLIGMTGTWSPCGFSMIETIGPTGHTGGRSTTIAACLTFLPGALIGALATFWTLAALGELVHGAGGRLALLLAAGLAIAAAVLEARGTPIVPQIRRQLPEHWRRSMPMPVASALYGGLLGLGFTTFVLTFGVWALAGVSFALGDPAIGLAIGIGFGVGRALPIVVLAPFADRPLGIRACETMAMRPSILRGFRLGDAVALLGVAAFLIGGSGQASAQLPVAERDQVAKPAADPSVGPAGELAYQLKNRNGVLETKAAKLPLPGKDPAVGGPWVAVRTGSTIRILDRRKGLAQVSEFDSRARPDALAVSQGFVAWRSRAKDQDKISVRPIKSTGAVGKARNIDRAPRGSQLGRPSLGGSRLVYALAKQDVNKLISRRIGKSGVRTLERSDQIALQNPSVRKGKVLYVRLSQRTQRLIVHTIKSGRNKRIYSRGASSGTVWSTSLGKERAFFTLIKGPSTRILATQR